MIHVLTIVLDGMPWITHHLSILNRVLCDWHWHIVEGVALPVNCTKWCQKIEPRYSLDGTHEYLESLKGHPRISIYQQKEWNGKVEMVNAPLTNINTPCILIEIDADEIWRPEQLDILHSRFQMFQGYNLAKFWCRYFIGSDIVTTTRNCYANNPQQEWTRAWRFFPGMKFTTHEPPVMDKYFPNFMTQDQTEAMGLVFDHYAYATEAQVRFKEQYYGYKNAVENWRALQANKKWPALLRNFLPWVTDDTMVNKLYES